MKKRIVWAKDLYKLYGTYFMSFVVPAVVFGIGLYLHGVFPFGDCTILVSDLKGQYSSFFAYLQSVLHGKNDFFYTFSKVLGGGFWDFGAYYLFSPFNLLLCFGEKKDIPFLIELIAILKLSCCGLTMNCFLQSRKKTAWTVVFSVCYALMGYNMVYLYHLMWLDGVILFPLIILGIDRLIVEQKRCEMGYSIALAAALCCNYYVGYMICVAVAIYTVIRVGFSVEKHNKLIVFGLFARNSILGGGLAAFVLIPTAVSLLEGKRGEMVDSFWKRNWNICDFFKALLPMPLHSADANFWNPSAPIVYCTIPVSLFALLFFFEHTVTYKKKLEYVILLGILIMMSLFCGSDTFWHALNHPAGFPYRYSFILTFIMITIAYEGITHISWEFIHKKWVLAFLSFLILVELGINTVSALGRAQNVDPQGMRQYQEKVAAIGSKLEELPPNIDFFRIEKVYDVHLNDAIMFGYNGLSHFSSSDKIKITDFMGKMGYTYFLGNGNWSGYTGKSTIVSDSLFALRFVFAEESPGKPWILYKKGIYENPYALSVANVFPQDVDNVVMDENPFEIQNQIYGSKVLKRLDIIPFNHLGNETCTYNIRADFEESSPVYLYLDTEDRNGISVSVNGGEEFSYKTAFENGVLYLGEYGIENIVLQLSSDNLKRLSPVVYQLDWSQFAECTEKIRENAVKINQISSSRLNGIVSVRNDGQQVLLFSIPYDRGWRVYLNGEKVTPKEYFGALMGIEIEKGEYRIDMIYKPWGWYVGIFISILSLGMIVCIKSLKIINVRA